MATAPVDEMRIGGEGRSEFFQCRWVGERSASSHGRSLPVIRTNRKNQRTNRLHEDYWSRPNSAPPASHVIGYASCPLTRDRHWSNSAYLRQLDGVFQANGTFSGNATMRRRSRASARRIYDQTLARLVAARGDPGDRCPLRHRDRRGATVGIRDAAAARAVIDAGATRIGTSGGRAILDGW